MHKQSDAYSYSREVFDNAANVTPNDDTDLAYVAERLYATGAGNIEIITPGGVTVVLPVTAGSPVVVRAARVKADNTTATGIVAVW